jgi:hypothetical protein
MSREVEYGIKVTAVDDLTPPMEKATASVKRFDAATKRTQDSLRKAMQSVSAFAGSMGRISAAGGRMGDALMKLGPSLNTIQAGAGALKIALGGLALATSATVLGFVSMASAASKVEQIETRTLAAIRERTTLTDAQFDAIKQLNAERERTLGIDADEQMQLQGTLVSMGVRVEQLDEATRATIGLSTATGQGLNEASRVVAKALGGNTAALQEYGIKVSSVAEAQGKFAQMFAVAAARADSYGARVSALGHSWDGLFESIGHVIVQSPAVNAAIARVTDTLVMLTDQLGPGSVFAQQFGATLGMVAENLQSMIAQLASPQGQTALQDFFQSALSSANSLATLLPIIAEFVSDIASRTANTARVMEEAGFFGMTFMGKDDVREAGEELRRQDRLRAAEAAAEFERMMRPGRESMMGAMLPGAGDGMGGLEDRAGKIRPFALLEKVGKGAGKGAGADAAKKAADELRDQRRRSEEADADMMLDITEWVVKQRNAAVESGLKKEQEARDQAAKQAAEVERAKLDAVRRRIEAQQQAEEAAKARAQQTFEELVSFFEVVGQNLVGIFSDAFSIIGSLQNKTTTEIVRNERGQLEERTRITEQYVATAGDALAKFLGDAGQMFAKAALNFIAIKAVEAAVAAIASAVGTFGLLGLVVAGGAAAVATALVAANKAKIPPPPKFFTGGVVPGPMGAPRLAMIEGGERVTSVADRVDGRGSGNATVVINNNLLAAPSRVQMERVNRDTVMPSMRRLQRLGFAS